MLPGDYERFASWDKMIVDYDKFCFLRSHAGDAVPVFGSRFNNFPTGYSELGDILQNKDIMDCVKHQILMTLDYHKIPFNKAIICFKFGLWPGESGDVEPTFGWLAMREAA